MFILKCMHPIHEMRRIIDCKRVLSAFLVPSPSASAKDIIVGVELPAPRVRASSGWIPQKGDRCSIVVDVEL